MKIIDADGIPTAVVVELRAPNGRPFYLRVRDGEFSFHSDRNSAGSLTDNPVVKTSADVFDWIKDDMPANGKKTFGERVRLQPRG